ncbi:RHS repeat-associated core domain-containing protein, partial [Laceyella putida]
MLRDYDPATGRFIIPDSHEGEEDDPITLNRYLYAEGDPVNNIDPEGFWLSWGRIWKGVKRAAKKAYNVAI